MVEIATVHMVCYAFLLLYEAKLYFYKPSKHLSHADYNQAATDINKCMNEARIARMSERKKY